MKTAMLSPLRTTPALLVATLLVGCEPDLGPYFDRRFDREDIERNRPGRRPRPTDNTLGARWEILNFLVPYGERSGQSAVSFNGRLILMGGNRMNGWANDVWASAGGLEWELLNESAPWAARSDHHSVVLNDRIYLMGGYDGSLLNDVWSSADGIEWRLETASAPWSARSHFRAVTFNDQIVVIAGQEASDRLNDVWVSRDGANWEQLPDAPWHPRSHFAAVVHDHRLFVIGGGWFDFDLRPHPLYPQGAYRSLNDVWATTDLINWEQIQGDYTETGDRTTFNRRNHHEVASLNGWLFLVNGDDHSDVSTLVREVWASQDGTNWRQLSRPSSHLRIERRAQFSLVVHDGKMFILGGVNFGGARQKFRRAILVSSGDLPTDGSFDTELTPFNVLPGDPGFRAFFER